MVFLPLFLPLFLIDGGGKGQQIFEWLLEIEGLCGPWALRYFKLQNDVVSHGKQHWHLCLDFHGLCKKAMGNVNQSHFTSCLWSLHIRAIPSCSVKWHFTAQRAAYRIYDESSGSVVGEQGICTFSLSGVSFLGLMFVPLWLQSTWELSQLKLALSP